MNSPTLNRQSFKQKTYHIFAPSGCKIIDIRKYDHGGKYSGFIRLGNEKWNCLFFMHSHSHINLRIKINMKIKMSNKVFAWKPFKEKYNSSYCTAEAAK